MPRLLKEFAQVTHALGESGIEYAVCGGWAMAIHGFPRATIDIDLLIFSSDLEEAWLLARSLGYDVEGLPLQFGEGKIEIRRISKITDDTKALITIDFLLVTDALRQVWDDRRAFNWEYGDVSSVSKEGLIFMKSISGRLQDLADIERLKNDN